MCEIESVRAYVWFILTNWQRVVRRVNRISVENKQKIRSYAHDFTPRVDRALNAQPKNFAKCPKTKPSHSPPSRSIINFLSAFVTNFRQ